MLNALGNSLEETARGLGAGDRGVGEITAFDATGFRHRRAAEARDFVGRDWLRPKVMRTTTRPEQMLLAATSQAVQEAALGGDPTPVAVFLGVGMVYYEVEDLKRTAQRSLTSSGAYSDRAFGETGAPTVPPLWVLQMLNNVVISHLATAHGFRGPNAVFSPFEDAGVDALDQGILAIQEGDAQVAIVGASSFPISMPQHARFSAAGHLADSDAPDAEGLVLGEGAAVLVLESEAHARARGARIFAEIVSPATPTLNDVDRVYVSGGYRPRDFAQHPNVVASREGMGDLLAAAVTTDVVLATLALERGAPGPQVCAVRSLEGRSSAVRVNPHRPHEAA